MKNCPDGFERSTTDIHNRCVLNKPLKCPGKLYNFTTRKCRIPCKSYQFRKTTGRKVCINTCKKGYSRIGSGKFNHCKRICPSGYSRSKRDKHKRCVKTSS
jgi:hypothetical protein